MFLNHALLVVAWGVYCGLHSVLASLPAKRFFQKQLGKAFRHYRLGYTLFAFAGLVAVVLFQVSIPTVKLYRSILFTDIAGGAISLSGLHVMAVCIRKYFFNLSGLRSLAQDEAHPVLEIKGIHRHVRHPLYSGTFLFIWGLFLLTPSVSLLVSNAVITGYTLLALKFEERKLVLQFGNAYRFYQQRVPPIIPKF